MKNNQDSTLNKTSDSLISFHSEDNKVRPNRQSTPQPNPSHPDGNQSDRESQLIESLMICNDVDIEDEINKAKDGPEGIFKMLSMSFYDKSVSSRHYKASNSSPPPLDDMYTTRPSYKAHTGIELKASPISPVARHISWTSVKLANMEPTKVNAKPKVKLFSIKEKADRNESLTQSNIRINLTNTTSGRMSPHTIFKDFGKEDRGMHSFYNPPSPTKGSPGNFPPSNLRLNTVNERVSNLIKTYSPKATVKRSNSKAKLNETSGHLYFNVSPRNSEVKPSTVLKKPTQANIKQISIKKKYITEESDRGSPTPSGYAFDRSRLEYKLDMQRVSANDVNYSVNLVDLQEKVNLGPAIKGRAGQSPSNYSNLLRGDVGKGYNYGKPHGRNTHYTGPTSPKLLLSQKLRISTEETEKPQGIFRNLLEHPQTTKNKTPKEKFINWTALKHRESSPLCSFSDLTENNRYSSKPQTKIQTSNANGMDFQDRSSVLALRCKTFEM